jgi:integrase
MYAARTEQLTEQIAKFLKGLQSIESDRRYKHQTSRENAYKRLCDKTLAGLRIELGVATVTDDDGMAQSIKGSVNVLHAYITQYRNAVKTLALNSLNSYSAETGPTGNRRIEQRHIALKYLVKTKLESVTRGEGHVTAIDTKQRSARIVSRSAAVETAKGLLKSNSYIALALGLSLLTGRRITEVLKTAKLTPITPSTMQFSGQLKTKGAEKSRDNYQIPVLADSAEIAAALDRLRRSKDFSSYSESQINSLTSKETGIQCRRYFGAIIPDVKPKDLRALYAQICWDTMGQDTPKLQLGYFAEILGHSEQDNITAVSYLVFKTQP